MYQVSNINNVFRVPERADGTAVGAREFNNEPQACVRRTTKDDAVGFSLRYRTTREERGKK